MKNKQKLEKEEKSPLTLNEQELKETKETEQEKNQNADIGSQEEVIDIQKEVKEENQEEDKEENQEEVLEKEKEENKEEDKEENKEDKEENKEEVLEEEKEENKDQQADKMTTKQQFIQFVKFLAFSLSAGFIQIVSFELFYTWTACLPWWPSYLISIVLSVVWNFTFNRKFTFKSASNVPVAMTLVLIYYCAFVPISVFGGKALEGAGWNGTLVTLLMMVINFLTEFFWDKYIVFNDKVTDKLLRKKRTLQEDENIENDNQNSEN